MASPAYGASEGDCKGGGEVGMKKLMLGTMGLVTAMVFAGGNVAFSAEATPSQHHEQAQVATGKATQEQGTKGVQAKSAKKKAKKKAPKQTRKPTKQVE